MSPISDKWRTLYLLNAAAGILAGHTTIVTTSGWGFAWYETGIYFFLQWLTLFLACLIVFEFIEFMGRV